MKKKYEVNLPATSFPMKGNLKVREKDIINFWKAVHCQKQSDKKLFYLHDGPPYANGSLHIGHAVNKVLKDIIVKYKKLCGYHAPSISGWDCHGLPIELEVERRNPKQNNKERIQSCRQYARNVIDTNKPVVERLGIISDGFYETMNPQVEADTIRYFGKLLEKGLVYEGHKPVHWCVSCLSPLANAEIVYNDTSSTAVDVKFSIGPNCSMVIWTTTPWTLVGNSALAIHPDKNYSEVDVGGERLVVMEELVEVCMQRYNVSSYKVTKTWTGAMLAGKKAKHPFIDREVPILAYNQIGLEGTGVMHVNPAQGQEDYELCMKNKVEMIHTVGKDGRFITGDYKGMHVLENDSLESILAELTKHNALLQKESFQHRYPYCWRHKEQKLIILATHQWFINLKGMADLKKSISEITCFPKWGRKEMENMSHNRSDWCISRQKAWGSPITLFQHVETRALHPDSLKILEEVAKRVEKEGIGAWQDFELAPEERHLYNKSSNILDVWFDSGVTHTTTAVNFPADVILEGIDQYRGWFQSMLLTGHGVYEKPSYRTVISHGFVVDEKGRKMSKSLGNVISIQDIVETEGADILRLWVSSTDYQQEITYSAMGLERTIQAYRKIRNTLRFLIANQEDYKDNLDQKDWLSVDRWMVVYVQRLQEKIRQHYDCYEFHQVYKTVHEFCNQTLSGFYFSILKNRLYTREGKVRQSAQKTLSIVLQYLLRWLFPILSFTAEEASLYHRHQESYLEKAPEQDDQALCHSVFMPAYPVDFQDEVLPYRDAEECLNYWQCVMDFQHKVNSRQEDVLKSTLQERNVLLPLIDEWSYLFHQFKSETLQLKDNTWFIVQTDHAKCPRCWAYRQFTAEVCHSCEGKEKRQFI